MLAGVAWALIPSSEERRADGSGFHDAVHEAAAPAGGVVSPVLPLAKWLKSQRCPDDHSAMGRAHRLTLPALAFAWLLSASVQQPRAFDAERMRDAAAKLGSRAVASVRELQPMLVAARALDETGQLQAVNDFYNRRVAFVDDLLAWGQSDHWASPLQMLALGQGDCEDYAIAKYFSLLALGMPSAKLRLVYVRAQLDAAAGTSQPHMVLAWYATPSAEPLILDNLIGELRPASRRPDLEPVFSFNSDGLWQGVGPQSAGDPVARLSRWREVLNKARAEGFL